mmetsp:Transcript_28190/g.51357  ORF Transcript_28190/g.51357 Transcript_28190/m.51357 type:complete len:89 (+) Transcript_28190:226-492(+)
MKVLQIPVHAILNRHALVEPLGAGTKGGIYKTILAYNSNRIVLPLLLEPPSKQVFVPWASKQNNVMNHNNMTRHPPGHPSSFCSIDTT